MVQDVPIAQGLLVVQYHGLEEQQIAVVLGHLVVFLAGDVTVVAETHGDEILVFPDIKAVARTDILPTGHLRFPVLLECTAARGGVQQPAAGSQPAQAVIFDVRAGRHVALDADRGIKFHHRAGHNAVERLDGGHLEKHRLVVHAVIHVDPAIARVNPQVFPAVERIGDHMDVVVAALRLAERDKIQGIHHRDDRHAAHAVPRKALCPLPVEPPREEEPSPPLGELLPEPAQWVVLH